MLVLPQECEVPGAMGGTCAWGLALLNSAARFIFPPPPAPPASSCPQAGRTLGEW